MANIPKGFWFYEVDSQLLFALRVACFAWEYAFLLGGGCNYSMREILALKISV